ncbi:hypothetical protein GCM10010394_46670 [Streptomyces crystallinus]|uniref:Uncharacterized protein n=1 Tax=Streptomyces crystallinus TaxID=68191 RepID=A0ABP3RJ74_9ACTN
MLGYASYGVVRIQSQSLTRGVEVASTRRQPVPARSRRRGGDRLHGGHRARPHRACKGAVMVVCPAVSEDADGEQIVAADDLAVAVRALQAHCVKCAV